MGTCTRCGFDVTEDDRMPCLDVVVCRSCASVKVPAPRDALGSVHSGPNYALALEVTDMRLAIELARAALNLGKYEDAKKALDLAIAPTKKTKRKRSAA